MPNPGDLCLLQDLKLYMGGVNRQDGGNDDVLSNLIQAASAFIARYLDRDLMSLGGQGITSVASVGTDAGGSFVTLAAPLPCLPLPGTGLIDVTTGAATEVVMPAGDGANTLSQLYVLSTQSLGVGDPLRCLCLQTYTDICNGSGKPWLWVRQWPIAEVMSVTDTCSGVTYPLAFAGVDPDLPRLTLRSVVTPVGGGTIFAGIGSGATFSQGIRNIQVTYRAGHCITPPDLAQATMELALLWFKNRDRIGVSAESMLGTHVNFFNHMDLLPESRIKLNSYRRTVSGF